MEKVLNQLGYVANKFFVCIFLVAWMMTGTASTLYIQSSSGELDEVLDSILVDFAPAPRPESPVVIGDSNDGDSEVSEYPLLL
jgi:hypothetical protein